MMASSPVLVSACLLGEKTRWDGDTRPCDAALRLLREGRAVAFCPEVAGGLSIPRARAECLGGDGGRVLDGHARVVDECGHDVTSAFVAGAAAALAACETQGISSALLCDGSPSCGTTRIADGRFSGTKVPGRGVAAALLLRAGVRAVAPGEGDSDL